MSGPRSGGTCARAQRVRVRSRRRGRRARWGLLGVYCLTRSAPRVTALPTAETSWPAPETVLQAPSKVAEPSSRQAVTAAARVLDMVRNSTERRDRDNGPRGVEPRGPGLSLSHLTRFATPRGASGAVTVSRRRPMRLASGLRVARRPAAMVEDAIPGRHASGGTGSRWRGQLSRIGSGGIAGAGGCRRRRLNPSGRRGSRIARGDRHRRKAGSRVPPP